MADVVLWFRRDLRLADHRALATALDVAGGDGTVVALFVIDPVLWDRAGDNRRWFLHGSLAALDADLRARGSGLVVRHGDPVDVLAALVAERRVAHVIRSQDVGPYGRRRDAAVAAALGPLGVEVIEADSPWAVPAGTLSPPGGDGYRVFSAFARAWRQRHLPPSPAAPDALPAVGGVRSDGLPPRPEPTAASLPEPGERAAHGALDRFVAEGADGYAEARNVPAADATSRLSAYLRFGTLHPRQLLRRLDGRRPGHRAFASELAWRDFYADVLLRRPDSAWAAWNPDMAGISTDTGPEADERFAAWCAGRTGYPLVDAGMRQLVAEGYVHNRVRMVTASFLVKDLHLDWQRGARFFMEHLVDGDLPSNSHGWQWVAGTGTDAAPYHRVFNPTLQAERFDPDGAYVRRWLPELGDPAAGYPPPIVDHAAERAEALARYAAR